MIVLINVFTVDPANQQRLLDLLIAATDGPVRRARGFISSTLHRSSDGTRVAMYARWVSLADYQAMRDDPESRGYFEEALSIAAFDPGLYEVVRSFTPAES